MSIVNADNKTWCNISDLENERERLLTFEGWENPFVNKTDLAQAGFFCLKHLDHVQCFFCGSVFGEWEEGDEPISEHVKWDIECPFIKRFDVSNTFTSCKPHDLPTSNDACVGDVTGRFVNEMESRFPPAPERKTRENHNDLVVLGITDHVLPLNPDYATYEARLRTYESWPTSISQRPEELASIGFYFVGISDYVRCFSCDGGLRNWEPSDDPLTQHRKHFKTCYFVNLLVNDDDVVSSNKTQKKSVVTSPSPNACSDIDTTVGDTTSSISQDVINSISLKGLTIGDSQTMLKPDITATEDESRPTNAILEENRQLKEMRLCKICMDEEIAVVFLPCRHFVSCGKCAAIVIHCPLCRKTIDYTVKTFLS